MLFLCTHNAGRSQMALRFIEALTGDHAVAWSGGSEPGHEVNPAAIAAPVVIMEELARIACASAPLPGRGRRSRCGQQAPDAVLGADPVEQHLHRTARRAESAGEYLAIEFLTDVKVLWWS